MNVYALRGLILRLRRRLRLADGVTATEYAIMLALIVIVCLTAITAVGDAANSAFTNIAGQLQSLPTGGN